MGDSVAKAVRESEGLENLSLLEVKDGRFMPPRKPTSKGELFGIMRDDRLVSKLDGLNDKKDAFFLADDGFLLRQIPSREVQDHIRRLVRPLVRPSVAARDSSLFVGDMQKKMKHTSFAFQEAFLRLYRLEVADQVRLEQEIPQQTSVEAAKSAYQRIVSEIPDASPKITPKMQETLRLNPASYVKTADVDAGSHYHSQPHWYVALELVRNLMISSGADNCKLIEKTFKNMGPEKSGELIKQSLTSPHEPVAQRKAG